jgi:hypothetical protein
MDDPELRRLLAQVQPRGRDILRRAMRAEHLERDELAGRLLCERSAVARDLADMLDLASIFSDVRQRLVRLLSELEAGDL